jgi:hypothetical protein
MLPDLVVHLVLVLTSSFLVAMLVVLSGPCGRDEEQGNYQRRRDPLRAELGGARHVVHLKKGIDYRERRSATLKNCMNVIKVHLT